MIRVCAGDPRAWLAQYRAQRPLFACVLSYTHTATIPGISAAGQTPQARQYTALADGEFLLKDHQSVGRTGTGTIDAEAVGSDVAGSKSVRYALPPLQGGVSPAVISRALLRAQRIPYCLLSTGLPGRLSVPYIALPHVIASSLESGQAMTDAQVHQLWQSGLHWGRRLARLCLGSYLIVGECVVGGTTTAQALLSALGYDVAGLMSSSHPSGNHLQKRRLVRKGLCAWRQRGDLSPMAAVAAVGDPMQVVVAAMAITASQKVGVLLAGGSQMLAVYALIRSVCSPDAIVADSIVVGTTRWVIEDTSADTVAIARAVGAPYMASELNFRQSRYAELRAYEQGFVKEGVGAGGCAIAANLYEGWGQSQIKQAVEAEMRWMT